MDALSLAAPVQTGATSDLGRARVFISYKRNVEPDEPVAMQVFNALRRHHDVFIDQALPVGTRWAEHIEAELRRADFLIPFLSKESIYSEMVLAELEAAHRLSREQQGRPVLLPVRLAYREPFQYPLSAYLNPINWALWDDMDDTERLIAELHRAIGGGTLSVDRDAHESVVQVCVPESIPAPFAAAQPRLEAPEGTMDPQSAFYVERAADRIAMDAIQRQGVTITIKGPRQMGKSSLLVRIMAAAAKAGKRVAYVDFQLFDREALGDADVFFRQFCTWITAELDLSDKGIEQCWQLKVGNSLRCTRYVGSQILTALAQPLVLAMDEVESVFETEFRSDFFSMLRNWHNSRRIRPLWSQLDLALVTSTEPYQLIDNLNQSPFNVGEVIELDDFSPGEMAGLHRLHGSPLSATEERRFMELVGGHPYLVRRALYLVASNRISIDDLFARATEDRGPFGDHLRYHLFRLHDKQRLIEGLTQVLRHNTCEDIETFWRLRGAGLICREGRNVVPRCRLYADYFRERLHA